MAALGINADTLAKIARHPGTGLVDTLQYLETVSKKTGVSMNTLITDTFGPGAVGLVTTLANHVGTLAKNVNDLSKASASKLDTAFGITKGQLNFQLNQLRTQDENALKGVGLLLLPAVGDIAKFAENAVTYFGKHPILKTIFTDASLTLFAASLAYKVGNALGKLPIIGNLLNKLPGFSKLFGGQPTAAQAETQIGLLEEIAGNTATTAAEGGVPKSPTSNTPAAGVWSVAALLGLQSLSQVNSFVHGSQNGAESGFTSLANGLGLNNTGPSGAPKKSGGYVNVGGAGLPDGTFILQSQLNELNSLYQAHKITVAQFNTAALNFAKQDTQRNYTLTVNIK